MDENGCEEALTVYVNWGIPEITRYIRLIFSAHTCKDITASEVTERLYTWSVTRKSDAPAPIKFNIKLETVTFMPELEDGEEQVMGEWLSRKIGQIIHPFNQRDINRTDITRPKNPVELWPIAPVAVQPTIREKDQILMFCVAEKKITSRQV
jgi:hypothetical protein